MTLLAKRGHIDLGERVASRFRRAAQDARYAIRALVCKLRMRWLPRMGVVSEPRSRPIIVSLTTIPERIELVSMCLDGLLRQTVKPDRVVLWLSESNQPGRRTVSAESLPPDLDRLKKRGLEVRWCRDIGSYRKIIPALHAFPDALIVTADDDIFYPRNWLEQLYEAWKAEPDFIHCHRAHWMTFDSEGKPRPYQQWEFFAPGRIGPSHRLFPTSGAGVLYAPGHLSSDVLNERDFLSLSPRADDVWLKAMALLAQVRCKKVNEKSLHIDLMRVSAENSLSQTNLEEGGNDVQIRAVEARYGVFSEAGRES